MAGPGTRVPVHNLVTYLKDGYTLEYFLQDFPDVSQEQARRFLDEAEKKVFASLEPVDICVGPENAERLYAGPPPKLAPTKVDTDAPVPSVAPRRSSLMRPWPAG